VDSDEVNVGREISLASLAHAVKRVEPKTFPQNTNREQKWVLMTELFITAKEQA
jgi:hypothetical protein